MSADRKMRMVHRAEKFEMLLPVWIGERDYFHVFIILQFLQINIFSSHFCVF